VAAVLQAQGKIISADCARQIASQVRDLARRRGGPLASGELAALVAAA